MQTALRFQDRFCASIDRALSEKGFVKADGERIRSVLAESAYRGPPIVYPGERIYIRFRDDSKPLFAVFVGRSRNSDSVTVLASNPREDISGASLSRQEQYLRKTVTKKSGPPERTAEGTASSLSRLSELKRSFRMQVHFHARNMLDNQLAHDDGWSAMGSIIRRALLNHCDFLCYTPHNAFEFENKRIASEILSEFGIIFPYASEITMPIRKNHPNGPHHIVVAGTREAAEEIDLSILRLDRSDINMPSYYEGATLDEMHKILQPMREAGSVIMGPAHPMNISERYLPINGIGLFSAVQLGLLSLDKAKEFAKACDFMECWNDSIYPGKISFRSKELETEMRRLLSKHGPSLGLPPGTNFSANLCNLLLALEFASTDNLGQSYGTDNHTEAPLSLGYHVGGDPFMRGWTTIEIPNDCKPPDRTFSSEEFVRLISTKKARMGAVLFTHMEEKDNTLHLAESRTERPKELKKIVSKMAREQYAKYVRDLARDFFGFLGDGDFEDIGNMGR